MRFSVDQINDNICVLEDINTGDILEVDISLLPKMVKEGSIVLLKDGIYQLELSEEEKRRISLRERMERLKNLNN